MKVLFQTLLTWFLIILAIRVFSFIKISFISDNIATITAVILVYTPVLLSLRAKKRIDYWKLETKNLIFSLKILFLFSLIVFPTVFLANHFFQKIVFGREFVSGTSGIWFLYSVTQLFVVAFPEEFFFRGFFQERINQIFPPRKKVFGVPFGWSQILVAGVFSLSHSLIHWQWWHFSIFFPALAFGWLKEKTGTIWAAVFFHAVCNMFSYWVSLHYR